MTQLAAATRTRTRAILLACTAGALLVAPASASAGLTEVDAIAYDPTRANVYVFNSLSNSDLTTPRTFEVSYSAGAIRVTDSGGVTAVAPNCAQVSPTIASCTNPAGTVIDDIYLYASQGPDTITTTSLGPNVKTIAIDGNKGADTINSGPTVDNIRADEGDDFIDGGLGADIVDGMEGIDTATYASRSEAVTVSVDEKGTPDGAGGGSEGDTVDTENVIGGSGNDKITGTKSSGFDLNDVEKKSLKSLPANVFTGGPGNDILKGGYDADTLDGGAGKDRLSGEASKDRLKGGAGKDRCSGGKGKDRARQCERETSIP